MGEVTIGCINLKDRKIKSDWRVLKRLKEKTEIGLDPREDFDRETTFPERKSA